MPAAGFDNLYHSLFSRQEGDAIPYKSLVLGCKYFFFLWEQYVLHRCYQNLCSKSLPETLKGCVPEAQFHRAQAYGRDKSRFSFAKAAFSLILETLWLTHNVLPWLWDLSRGIMVGLFGFENENEIIQSLIFFQIKSTIEVLLELPSELYRIFVVEERHGFNKQSGRLFMRDLVVTTLIKAVIETPFYAGLIKVFKMGDATFYIYAWLFV
ncbi:CAAX prenyl protease 1 [Mortierella sp. 14UC]|nr:CAAX prenyl protease 1 [Mortierella sp. 14UC]